MEKRQGLAFRGQFQASGMQSYTVFGGVDPIVAATAPVLDDYSVTSVISPALFGLPSGERLQFAIENGHL